MIVKILKKSRVFPAVRYNTNKVDKEKGELLKVVGFDSLEGLSEKRPEDYINYLSAVSARNKRIEYPQFHAVISAKGKSSNKNDLTAIAEKWLSGMGYTGQPYLLIFHKDTANNHIHLVSSRIDREGRKISDQYEKIRAYRVLNQILGQDQKSNLEKAIREALSYQFSTRSQFMFLLELKGYSMKLDGNKYAVSKFGERIDNINIESIDQAIRQTVKDENRKKQLKSIFLKYRSRVDARLFPKREKVLNDRSGRILNYESGLSLRLSADFGLSIIFHFKGDRPPYGYSIVDHTSKQVFKGGEIMPIHQFMDLTSPDISSEPTQSLQELNDSVPHEEFLLDDQLGDWSSLSGTEDQQHISIGDFSIGFDISDDIDDEQILGRNRRRQRKARTNTR